MASVPGAALPSALAGGLSTGGLLGLGAASGVASGIINAAEQQSTNTQESNMMDKQYSEELYMSNTAEQRGVADLKAAGLNPILAAGANGASTPSVGLPNLTAPQVHMPDIMSGAISMKQLDQADQKLDIDRANSASAIAKNLTDNDLTRMQTILSNKGIIPAQMEGDLAAKVQTMVKGILGAGSMNHLPGTKSQDPAIQWGDMTPNNPYPRMDPGNGVPINNPGDSSGGSFSSGGTPSF